MIDSPDPGLGTSVLGIIVILVALALCGVVGFVTHSLGVWGNTVVEREVFEASYQRTASLQERVATEEANIAELRRKLQNPTLDEGTKANLEAQLSASRVRLESARRMQEQ